MEVQSMGRCKSKRLRIRGGVFGTALTARKGFAMQNGFGGVVFWTVCWHQKQQRATIIIVKIGESVLSRFLDSHF